MGWGTPQPIFTILKPKEVIPMAIKERKCLSCTTSYKYCPSCSRVDALAPAWKSQFCSEPCATLWTTLTKFSMNRITKAEAKSIIEGLDLKSSDAYVKHIQRDYDIVMAEEKKPKRGKRAEMKILDEVMEIEPDVIEPIAEEQPIEVAEQVALEPAHEVILEEKE